MTPKFESPTEEHPQFGTLLMINIEQFFLLTISLAKPKGASKGNQIVN
jgi:hypothetical protein